MSFSQSNMSHLSTQTARNLFLKSPNAAKPTKKMQTPPWIAFASTVVVHGGRSYRSAKHTGGTGLNQATPITKKTHTGLSYEEKGWHTGSLYLGLVHRDPYKRAFFSGPYNKRGYTPENYPENHLKQTSMTLGAKSKFSRVYLPENGRMSLENQWLEDAFPIEIVFGGVVGSLNDFIQQ